jgi:8-oxo-dGTP pyrophosphatase MutT (NUDIX family)
MARDTIPLVYKAGAVILRRRADGTPEILITRPKPAREGERPKLVLPRGSRQYRSGGQWIDARDEATAQANAATLEPLRRTVMREMEEEAGLPAAVFDGTDVTLHELGIRQFASSSKPPYDIYWMVILPNEAALSQMLPMTDHLLEPVQWLGLAGIEALVEAGDFSAGYVSVIRETLEKFGS